MSRISLLERHKNGDSYVFNTDLNAGQHWFALLYAGGVWYLLDFSALTTIEYHLKIINKLRCDVDMQVGQLHAVDSMTCGEHSISFLYFAMKVFNDDGNLGGIDYCNMLKKASVAIWESAEQLVTNFVYSGRFKVEKPDLDNVDEWLREIGVSY